MKKFISFVMAGAMIASLVPATAFAKGELTATAKVVDAKDMEKGQSVVFDNNKGPELQIKVGSADYTSSNTPSAEFDVDLEDAEFAGYDESKSDAYNAGIIRDLVDIIWDDASSKTFDPGVYNGTSTSTTEYVAEADFATATGIAKNNAGVIDQTTFIGKNTFSAEVLKGDALRTALVDPAVGYAPQGDGSYYKATAAGVVNGVDYTKTLYTASDIATGIEIKTLQQVVDADITANHADYVYVKSVTSSTGGGDVADGHVALEVKDVDKDSVTLKFYGKFHKDDKITIALKTKLTKTSEGTKATVSVDSKAVKVDDLVFASILGSGVKASVKKVVDIAEDEVVKLNSNGVKIESTVGDFKKNQEFNLKLSNGFEFSKVVDGAKYTFGTIDDNEVTVKYIGDGADEFTIDGNNIEIEATSAKSGSVATLTVKALKTTSLTGSFSATTTVEVAKVVDYKVNLTVDEDEDIPVIYSGTNVANKGLTDDSDHISLEVTAKESFPGAWSMRQGFDFTLPEGVYVTDVDVVTYDHFTKMDAANKETNVDKADWENAFFEAYQEGDHKKFEFKKRVFNDVNTTLQKDPAKLTFKLTLVADPTFEGDVTLGFEGALVDKQTVKIAKFVKPYTVKAEQNDVIIDYRNTEVKTPIVITEAEAGLWEKGNKDLFKLNIEDDLLTFENDPTFTVDSASDMELKDEDTDKGTVVFSVKSESDKPASVTISDMKLYMSRSIPAGAYDLELSTVMSNAYKQQVLFAPDADTLAIFKSGTPSNVVKTAWDYNTSKAEYTRPSGVKEDSYVDDVCDYSDVVKEAFINVVTGGVDKDNMFTTKVVVPVGESYLIAGSTQSALDAPAYISAAGYTMLPVRAVANALGIATNNVLWSADTKTVTIMYSQRIITMTVGTKTIYVNGSAIPASAAPEIKDGRTFLPLRDLGTALGVTDVTWDASTKTATLNGGTKTTTTATTATTAPTTATTTK